MFRPYTMAQLKRRSDEQIMAAYDVAVEQTIVGADYYLEELRRREQTRVAAEVKRFTRWIFWLTLVVTVATIINVVIASLALAGVLGGGSEGDAR